MRDDVREQLNALRIPPDVLDLLGRAVATLAIYGPQVADALKVLGEQTTNVWLASMGMEKIEDLADRDPATVPCLSDEAWSVVEQWTGIARGWDLAYMIRDCVDE